ncbi:MAG: helix-turn-helix domain-containing protein [Microbacterium sp.]|uniref:helix-turn-helix domain-containing protein n=1 Tax=Microbacterium sp. TaxID=51671 RepID=UPI001D30B0B8|nr:helix-turn-helix transcriptional regulator [Microbacterium sp.]MBW8763711.1 helix-turn-helix domain-containing protein [Microbacterium sp.]
MSDAPDTDTLAAFASDLRKLRLSANQPTLDRLAREAHISRTVISETLNGRQFPSPRTVDRIVRALGADPDEWIARRDRLARARSEEVQDAGEIVERRSRRRLLLMLGAAVPVLLLGGAAGCFVGYNWGTSDGLALAAEERVQIKVEDGLDPAKTACIDDSEVGAAHQDEKLNALLEVMWSDKCQAGWGRITRYDALELGNSITVRIYPLSNPSYDDGESDTVSNARTIYTYTLNRPGGDPLCAEGSFTVEGKTFEFDRPVCM